MKYGKLIGMFLFVVGLVLLIIYSLYQGFQNITLEEFDIVISISVIITIIGLIILFICILFEQQEGKKKLKNDIKKEELEP